VANYKRPTFTGLQSKVDTKGLRTTNSLLSLQSRIGVVQSIPSGQLNHQMPNIKGVKHKVDTKGTDLTKLPPSPVKIVHQGLPYKRNGAEIRPKVSTWRYQNYFNPNASFTLLSSLEGLSIHGGKETSTQTVELKDFSTQINAKSHSVWKSHFTTLRAKRAMFVV